MRANSALRSCVCVLLLPGLCLSPESCGGAVEEHSLPRTSCRSSAMPRTKNVPQRNEGAAAREVQRATATLAAAPAPAPAPAPHPNAPPLGAGGSGPSGVAIKQEEEEEEEEEEEASRRDGAAPDPARVPASGPRATLATAPAPHHDAPAAGGGGVSGVTLIKEEEAEETLAQQRDRLALALAHGPVRVDSHIKVEDSTSGDDTDGDGVDGEAVRYRAGRGAAGRKDWAWKGGWCCTRGRCTSRTTGEHRAGAPLRTGRPEQRGGEAMSQPPTKCLTPLHRSGTVEARKSDSPGVTACTSSPEGTLGRTPRGSNGARDCPYLANV